MKFIEIRDGFSVSIDAIEAINRDTDLTSVIHTRFNEHKANFPYLTLLRILEGEEEEGPKQEVMHKLEAVLDRSQHFAG